MRNATENLQGKGKVQLVEITVKKEREKKIFLTGNSSKQLQVPGCYLLSLLQ